MSIATEIKNVIPEIKKIDLGTRILHDSFELGIFMKGINGLLEIAGGILLMFISPVRLDRIIKLLTQHELAIDPNNFLANFILHLSHGFSVSAQHFGVIYLISHGIVKIILFVMLWKKILWSYPLSIIFFILFIGYQMYRYAYHHSIWMIILTVFDLIIIFLVWNEYLRIKAKQAGLIVK